MKIQDAVTLADARVTGKGYLEAFARSARTGVQLYTGDEMGRPEMDVVRVYRPEGSVFDPESLLTFGDADITIGHPEKPVDSETWNAEAVGEVYGGALRDGEWVKFGLRIRDASAVKAVQDGVRELSVGYTAEIEWTDGVTPEGEAYDAIQKNIEANHIAIVPRARAGSEARIGDEDAGKDRATWGATPIHQADERKPAMADNLQNVVLGDKAVPVASAHVADVENWKASQAKALSDAEAKHAKDIAAKDEEIGKLKADLKTAQDAAMTPEKIRQFAKDRAKLETTAKAVSDKLDLNLDDAELRKAAVAHAWGDDMVKDASEAEITGMFKKLAADSGKSDPVADALKSGATTQDADPWAFMDKKEA